MSEKAYEPSQIHTIETAVKLVAPREVGVRLVSADDVEQAEASFFWCTIFFGIFTAILGALISSCAGGGSSGGVRYVLLLFLIVFLALFITFGIAALKRRRRTRELPTVAEAEEKPEQTSAERALLLLGAIQDMQRDLLTFVFRQIDELPEQEVVTRFMKLCADDMTPAMVKDALNMVWIGIGMLKKETKPDGTTVLRIDREFSVDRWFEKNVLPHHYTSKGKAGGKKAQPKDPAGKAKGGKGGGGQKALF